MPSAGSTLAAFRENLRAFGATQVVEERIMTSIQAASTWDGAPIRLVFINGAHEYEAVESDFLNWEPLLSPGGIIPLVKCGGATCGDKYVY